MSGFVRTEHGADVSEPFGVALVSRAELTRNVRWTGAFAGKRKDHRFYELVEDTLQQGFEYRYFAIKDALGEICSVQPFFMLEQDLIAGAGSRTAALTKTIRRMWPRFLTMRTMMVGCVVGEGHLDGDESSFGDNAKRLASAIKTHARDLRASLIVLKEFPKEYREPLRCFLDQGFSRVPSLPMTRLNIDYADFEDYMNKALNSATRRKLRKKFRIAAAAAPIEMSVVGDITPFIDEAFPLYIQVYERSKLHFEKLTKDFLCGVGRLMPDKAGFFIWRQDGRIVAFTLCMFEGDTIYTEYIGLDYSVALELHLYHYAVRDMTAWAIANGYKQLRSSGLNYDPKLHLRHELAPIDLYVRHRSPVINAMMRWILPLIEPTRHDPTLKMFPNYDELWDRPRAL
jgi:predicted N-acyltransferase